MRILMLNYEYPPLGGGAATATRYLLEDFGKTPDVTVDLVTSSPGKYAEERPAPNITIYRLPVGKKNLHYWTAREIALWSWKTYAFARRLLRKQRYDLCHCWFGWPSGVLGYALRRHIPYIVALRGTDMPGYSKRVRILDMLVMRSVSRIVWRSARIVTVLTKDAGRLAAKTLRMPFVTIPNGVDTKRFRPGRKTWKGTRVLYVGRLVERKGVEYLIRAFGKLVREHSQATLTIVGGGKDERWLRQLVREQSLGGRVTFTGPVARDRIPAVYRRHDILVLPSEQEALGNVVLEAMASGLAIVTTKTGAAEFLQGNGLLIRKRDVTDIARKLARLVDDPQRAACCKRRSRTLAQTLSWKTCARRYLAVYKDACGAAS